MEKMRTFVSSTAAAAAILVLFTLPVASAFSTTSIVDTIPRGGQYRKDPAEISRDGHKSFATALGYSNGNNGPAQPLPDTTDPFIMLGLDASRPIETKDVKRAYRRMALLHHPDVVVTMDSTDEERKRAGSDFARINAAYEFVMDRHATKDKVGFGAPVEVEDDVKTPSSCPSRKWERSGGNGVGARSTNHWYEADTCSQSSSSSSGHHEDITSTHRSIADLFQRSVETFNRYGRDKPEDEFYFRSDGTGFECKYSTSRTSSSTDTRTTPSKSFAELFERSASIYQRYGRRGAKVKNEVYSYKSNATESEHNGGKPRSTGGSRRSPHRSVGKHSASAPPASKPTPSPSARNKEKEGAKERVDAEAKTRGKPRSGGYSYTDSVSTRNKKEYDALKQRIAAEAKARCKPRNGGYTSSSSHKKKVLEEKFAAEAKARCKPRSGSGSYAYTFGSETAPAPAPATPPSHYYASLREKEKALEERIALLRKAEAEARAKYDSRNGGQHASGPATPETSTPTSLPICEESEREELIMKEPFAEESVVVPEEEKEKREQQVTLFMATAATTSTSSTTTTTTTTTDDFQTMAESELPDFTNLASQINSAIADDTGTPMDCITRRREDSAEAKDQYEFSFNYRTGDAVQAPAPEHPHDLLSLREKERALEVTVQLLRKNEEEAKARYESLTKELESYQYLSANRNPTDGDFVFLQM